MKNLAASVHAQLIQRRAKTGEDFNLLLVRFTLERLLYRLSRSKHRDQFILKGAMLFSIWEPTLHRATRDLDLLGFGNPSQERLTDVFRQLAELKVEPDGVEFDSRSVVAEEIRAQDEYVGVRIKLKAHIGKAVIPLQVDVGFGDALSIKPEEVEFPVMLDMPAPNLLAYTAVTVVAEKVQAICELGMLNTRFKDYFDLHYLSQKFSFDGTALSDAVAATFERRATKFPDGLPVGLTSAFGEDPVKITGWEAFCRKTLTEGQHEPLNKVIIRLVSFLDPIIEGISKGQPISAEWQTNRWVQKKK